MNFAQAKQYVKDDPNGAARIIAAAHKFAGSTPRSFTRQLTLNDAMGPRCVKAFNAMVDSFPHVITEGKVQS